jgi:hypothetical protein
MDVMLSSVLGYNERDDDRNVVRLPAGESRPLLFPALDAVRRVPVRAPRCLVRKAGDDLRHVPRGEPHGGAHPHDPLQLVVRHVVEQPVRAHHHDVAFLGRDLAHLRVAGRRAAAGARGVELQGAVEVVLLRSREAQEPAVAEHGEAAIADVRPPQRPARQREDDGRRRRGGAQRDSRLVRALQEREGADVRTRRGGHHLQEGVLHEAIRERAGVHASPAVRADAVRHAEDAVLGVPEVRILVVVLEVPRLELHPQAPPRRIVVAALRGFAITVFARREQGAGEARDLVVPAGFGQGQDTAPDAERVPEGVRDSLVDLAEGFLPDHLLHLGSFRFSVFSTRSVGR